MVRDAVTGAWTNELFPPVRRTRALAPLPQLVGKGCLEEVRDLLAKTPFVVGAVEQRDGIAIKVKKRIREPAGVH